jgi:hypothetical protein
MVFREASKDLALWPSYLRPPPWFDPRQRTEQKGCEQGTHFAELVAWRREGFQRASQVDDFQGSTQCCQWCIYACTDPETGKIWFLQVSNTWFKNCL